jgi:hypothetical protein
VLHTWGQTLSQHLHVHCLVAAGALDAAGQWVRSRCGFLFPVKSRRSGTWDRSSVHPGAS